MYRIFPCFFFNDPATTEIYTLSLHDALPISRAVRQQVEIGPLHLRGPRVQPLGPVEGQDRHAVVDRPLHDLAAHGIDRKSTRLNSSHANISYAVFCLKKKKYILTLT